MKRLALAAMLLALLAPLGVYPVFLMSALCFAIFASAFNLLVGYAGLLSFGHAAYFGFASYVTAYAVKLWGLDPLLGILLGAGAGGLLGLALGVLAIRRQGIYFAMITLALSQMVYFYTLQAKWTGGEDGIQAVPRRMLFGVMALSSEYVMYYVVLAIFLAALAAIHRTIHSPFGQVLKAIRENEPRAISLGYDVDRYKLLAFVLSATLAGLAGGTKALVTHIASLTDVQWQMSGEVVLMTLVGGMGTVLGPAVGAFVIVMMQNYLATAGEWILVIQGGIFAVTVLAFRRGIVGELNGWWDSRRARRVARQGEPQSLRQPIKGP